MYTENYRKAIRRFRNYFILFSVITLLVFARVATDDQAFRKMTSPVTVDMNTMVDSAIHGPAYVELKNYCMDEEHASWKGRSSKEKYYSFLRPCDSFDPRVIILKQTEEQYLRMKREMSEDPEQAAHFFTGKLEHGFSERFIGKMYIYGVGDVDQNREHIYTLFSEETPASNRRENREALLLFFGLAVGVLALMIYRRHVVLQKAKFKDAQMQMIIDSSLKANNKMEN